MLLSFCFWMQFPFSSVFVCCHLLHHSSRRRAQRSDATHLLVTRKQGHRIEDMHPSSVCSQRPYSSKQASPLKSHSLGTFLDASRSTITFSVVSVSTLLSNVLSLFPSMSFVYSFQESTVTLLLSLRQCPQSPSMASLRSPLLALASLLST